MKKFIALLLCLPFFATALAQTAWEVETDPLAWAAGGGSLHAAFSWKNERIQIGYAVLGVPSSLRQFEDLSEHFQSVSLKWDYFPLRDDAQKGWFVGPTMDLMRWTYENSDATLERNALNLGVRTGYKVDLFPKRKMLGGFYLTPWVGLSYNTADQEIQVADQSYTLNPIQVFPTVHLGYRF